MSNRNNTLFVEKLQDPGQQKTASAQLTKFLRMRTYEDSTWSRVLPPVNTTIAECSRIPSQDNGGVPMFRQVIDKEFTDISAQALDFRGQAGAQYVETDTFNVDFNRISSPTFVIDEGELAAKTQPIQAILKNGVTSHIDRAIDEAAYKAWVAALALTTGKDITTTDDYMLPRNLTDLINTIEGQVGVRGRKTLTVATLVIPRPQWNSMNKWTSSDLNALLGADYWRDGYQYDKLFKKRVVVTDKLDIFPANEIWAFVAPEFLGSHMSLNDDRFEIQKDFTTLKFKGWKSHGSTIGNVEGLARLKLGQ